MWLQRHEASDVLPRSLGWRSRPSFQPALGTGPSPATLALRRVCLTPHSPPLPGALKWRGSPALRFSRDRGEEGIGLVLCNKPFLFCFVHRVASGLLLAAGRASPRPRRFRALLRPPSVAGVAPSRPDGDKAPPAASTGAGGGASPTPATGPPSSAERLTHEATTGHPASGSLWRVRGPSRTGPGFSGTRTVLAALHRAFQKPPRVAPRGRGPEAVAGQVREVPWPGASALSLSPASIQ